MDDTDAYVDDYADADADAETDPDYKYWQYHAPDLGEELINLNLYLGWLVQGAYSYVWLLYVADFFDCGGHGRNKHSIVGADWLAYLAYLAYLATWFNTTLYYYTPTTTSTRYCILKPSVLSCIAQEFLLKQ